MMLLQVATTLLVAGPTIDNIILYSDCVDALADSVCIDRLVFKPHSKAASIIRRQLGGGGAYMQDLIFYLANTPPFLVPRLVVDMAL